MIASSAARAFCAGGDIREVHGHITENDKDAVTAFFRAEYMMDVTVAEFDKPVIALADGLVIGGGAGLAQACRHVVISEATRLAMPEAAIGLFPDAGASLFWRCPRAIALYLGQLTVCVWGWPTQWCFADGPVASCADAVRERSDRECDRWISR